MAVTANQISSQVAGAIQALEKLPAKEREIRPSVAYIENYNNLLALAKEAMPDVDERRWPPEAVITRAMGMANVDVRFTEVHSFLAQIHAILSEGILYGI